VYWGVLLQNCTVYNTEQCIVKVHGM